ncbi:hypothetical protein ACGFMM_10885 [Streptomyces sp. NPDC048604]|uniref:hypothetical protein n=1 Tax=Streptomyces sp. NPDC048604 TaxID=3365578 RepID=UPI00371C00E9
MTATLRRTAAALCLVALAAAVSGCTQEGKPSPGASSATPSVSSAPGTGQPTAPAPSPKPTTSPSASTAGLNYGDPEAVASAYVDAYVRQNWAVDAPRAYLKRIKPYATASYIAKLRGSSSDRCDLMCEADKKSGVRVSADGIGTVIPPEAPRTSRSVWVQVSYVERTSWPGGGDGSKAYTVLELVKSGSKWLVNANVGG